MADNREMVRLRIWRTEETRRRTALVSAALLCLLGSNAAWCGSKNPPPAQTSQIAPSLRIPLQPLGFQMPGKTVAIDRTSVLALSFLDSDHLLFTFRLGGLLKRLPDCPREDEDQEIRAVVLELPSGKVSATADWRMHDHGRYLWPLSTGQVLIRQRDTLFTTDATLHLKPYVESKAHMQAVQESPDGKLVLVEIDAERHGQEEHQKLVDEARQNGSSPPHEDVELIALQPKDATVLARSLVHHPLLLPMIQQGFVEVLPDKKTDWLIRYAPFKGDPQLIGKVNSTCTPSPTPLDANVFSLMTCPPAGGDRQAVAFRLTGERLWTAPWDSHFVWPKYSYAAEADRVAVGALRLNHSVSAIDLINDEDIEADRVQVIDTATGKIQLALEAKPVISAGQNFALSPDGLKFAILRDNAVELYELPLLATLPPPAVSTAAASKPGK